MSTEQKPGCRHFASYTGVSLPLNLITPLDDSDLDRRITYFRGYYDDRSRLVALEKVVYGEIEFEHRYAYHPDGRLKSAELREPDEAPRLMEFD
jgi:pyruvate-formate lyase-activating enzyme